MKRPLNVLTACVAVLISAVALCSRAQTVQTPAVKAQQKYPPLAPTHKDVVYLAPDRPQKMDIYLPKVADGKSGTLLPAVVVIHGGGWSGGKKIWGYPVEFAKRAVPAGYAVFCPEYQLNEFAEINGRKECTRRGGPQNILDCLDAISFVRLHAQEYGVDPERICVAGDSAGGQLAMLAGYGADSTELGKGRLYPQVSPGVRCIVNYYGVANFETFPAWGGWSFLKSKDDPDEVKAALLKRYSPVNYITAASAPTLIVHGRNDPGVTYKQSEELAAKLTELRVSHQFITLEKATKHAFNFESDEFDLTAITLKFLNENSAANSKDSKAHFLITFWKCERISVALRRKSLIWQTQRKKLLSTGITRATGA